MIKKSKKHKKENKEYKEKNNKKSNKGSKGKNKKTNKINMENEIINRKESIIEPKKQEFFDIIEKNELIKFILSAKGENLIEENTNKENEETLDLLLKKSFDNGKSNNIYYRLMKMISKKERQFDNEKRKKLKEVIKDLENKDNKDILLYSFKEGNNGCDNHINADIENNSREIIIDDNEKEKNKWTFKKGSLETEEIYESEEYQKLIREIMEYDYDESNAKNENEIEMKDIDNKKINDQLINSVEKTKPPEKKSLSCFISLKYPSLRYKFLILCVLWFGTRLISNAIALYSKALPGNYYFNIIFFCFKIKV